MGYTRVVQYGDITQIYQYSREYHYKERYISPTEKKRKKKRDLLKVKTRTKRSIYRSRLRFFRLCHHNNIYAKTISFCTLTFATNVSQQEAQRAISEFYRRINRKIETTIPISYVSVPEVVSYTLLSTAV